MLKYARSSLDYSVGEGLYMLPSDMLLKPLNQVIDGYNDKIVLNTSGHALGRVIPHVETAAHAEPKGDPLTRPQVDRPQQRRPLQVLRQRPPHVSPLEAHNEEKMALTLGLVGLALFAIWCF